MRRTCIYILPLCLLELSRVDTYFSFFSSFTIVLGKVDLLCKALSLLGPLSHGVDFFFMAFGSPRCIWSTRANWKLSTSYKKAMHRDLHCEVDVDSSTPFGPCHKPTVWVIYPSLVTS